MILIETYPCDSKLELLKRERYWTENLKATLNQINGQGLELELGKSGADKLYYGKNKEKIKLMSKHYAETHKEQKFEYNKKYRENNKAKIAERKSLYQKEIVTCFCGLQISRGNKSHHLKLIKHQNALANNQQMMPCKTNVT